MAPDSMALVCEKDHARDRHNQAENIPKAFLYISLLEL
jgi:hypothetical protein